MSASRRSMRARASASCLLYMGSGNSSTSVPRLSYTAIALSSGSPLLVQSCGKCSASTNAVSGANRSTSPTYCSINCPTRFPSTARIRMFASSTSDRSATAFLVLPQLLEILHEFILAHSILSHPFLHDPPCFPKRRQILRGGLAAHRNVKPDRAAVLCHSDGLTRFRVVTESVAEIPHANFCSVHDDYLVPVTRCHPVYPVVSRCATIR